MKSKSYLVFYFVLILLYSPNVFSESMSFEGSGEYVLGDNDTITEAKKFALQEAKRIVLEKMGTYLQSKTEIKNYSVTKDEIITYSQGSIKVKKVSEERFAVGEKSLGVRINILAEADSDEILNKLNAISKQDKTKDEIAQLKMEYDSLKKQISKINMELKKERDENKISFLREERKAILQKIENREEGISILTSGQGLFNEALIQKKRFEEDKGTINQFVNELVRAYKIEVEKPSIRYEMDGKATIHVTGKIMLPGKYGEFGKKHLLHVPTYKTITDMGISCSGPFIRSQPSHKYLDCNSNQGNNRASLSVKHLKRKLSKLSIEAIAGNHRKSYLLPIAREGHSLLGLYIERDFEITINDIPMDEIIKINKIDIKISCGHM